MSVPVTYRWTGEGMVPLGRYRALCLRTFAKGRDYRLVVDEERSPESEKHYFASLRDAWMNLPREAAKEFLSVEHLRAHALIRTGFCDKSTTVWATKSDALQFAAMADQIAPLSIVEVDGTRVTIWTAHSQSRRAMKKDEFQKSKDAVLDWAWGLSGVSREEHEKHGGNAA